MKFRVDIGFITVLFFAGVLSAAFILASVNATPDDDRVQIADSNSLDLTDTLTLEAWIKPDITIEWNHTWSYLIICKWHGIGDQWRTGYALTIGGAKEQGTPSYLILLLGFGSGQFGWCYHSVTDSWTAGVWYHVKATYDKTLPSGNVKLYVNDILEAQYDETRSIATNTLSLFIPADPFEGWHPYNRVFPGVIDEVRVAGASTVGLWHFDEGMGNTAYDSSGNGNHGTIYGASWTTGIVGSALRFTFGLLSQSVPEFPLGSAMYIAAIPVLFYIWWRRKNKLPR